MGNKSITKEPSKSRQRVGHAVIAKYVGVIDGALLRLTRLEIDVVGHVSLAVICVTPPLFATMVLFCCSLLGIISS